MTSFWPFCCIKLINYSEYILDYFQLRLQVDIIYTDFSKAFDKEDHQILLIKMGQFVFPRDLLGFYHSNLITRTQFISYQDTCSDKFLVQSGMPQGSNLGWLLFSISYK